MNEQFEIAGGTVCGRDHFQSGKNNHDAYHWLMSDQAIIAIVCDGCGSGKHSEVGAQLGARLIAEAIARQRCRFGDHLLVFSLRVESLLERARLDVLAQLRVLANSMGESLTQIVNDYFLFTALGVLITPYRCSTFSLGDGIIIVNEEITRLGPFVANEPPYLAYGLVGSSLTQSQPELLNFQIHQCMPTAAVKSILIGTDGVADLIKTAEKKMPGKKEFVGQVSQFWQEDRYFKNPDMVRRKLTLVNREVVKVDQKNNQVIREIGLLPDDTTLVVIRKKVNKERGG